LTFEAAGRAGIDPGPYKLRELCWLADGRNRAEWDQTALMCSALFNQIRDPKRKRLPFAPSDFHPYHETQRPGLKLNKRNRPILRKMFDTVGAK